MKLKVRHIIILVIFLSAVLVCFTVFKTVFTHESEKFETAVFQSKNGYGYSISFKNKLLIKQDFIPAIQKSQPFCNSNDAQKVAYLVAEKLNKKENPRVTLSELNDLNIQLNCLN